MKTMAPGDVIAARQETHMACNDQTAAGSALLQSALANARLTWRKRHTRERAQRFRNGAMDPADRALLKRLLALSTQISVLRHA